MRNIFLTFALAVVCLSASAQSNFSSILQQVELNNPTLKALRASADAEKLTARTGLAPTDPEVEFHYLWGSQTAGNRVDLSIKQSFDFPSVYAFKSKVAKMEGEVFELQYRVGRMELLTAVGQLCTQIVYYNATIAAYQGRITDAQAIADAYTKKLASGDGNKIESNRSQLTLRTLQAQAAQLKSERSALLTELAGFNDGQAVELNSAKFDKTTLPPSFEDWALGALENNPTLSAALAQVDVAQNQVRVEKSKWLPKISVGYMSERVLTAEHFQGIIAGISLPLWENSRAIKAAKATAIAGKGRADEIRRQIYTNLRALYERAVGLNLNAQLYTSSVTELNSTPLMKRALEQGEISLFEYITEAQLYYDNENSALQAQRDFQLCYVELLAFEL